MERKKKKLIRNFLFIINIIFIIESVKFTSFGSAGNNNKIYNDQQVFFDGIHCFLVDGKMMRAKEREKKQ